ncbi:MAG: hypothetical protein HYY44_02610 [Deltaproteobacteria bacterium]|nr:hypothetical protein [Deltaproteobacteria bacterium]
MRTISFSLWLPGLWWLALYWTFSSRWPRPFDDWKNSLLYVGGGLFCLYFLWQRRKEPAFRFNVPVLFLFLYLVVSLLSLQRPLYEGGLAFARLILWVGVGWALWQLKKETLFRIARLGLFSASLIALLSFLETSWRSTCPLPFTSLTDQRRDRGKFYQHFLFC